MEKIKVGIIGLGCRGKTMGTLVAEHENCAVTAICDEYQDRCDDMKEKIAALGHDPKIYLNYEELIASPDVEMVFVFSAWENHVPAAVASMKAGKPVAFEVGGAYTIDECIQLCQAHRETGTPAMMLENCCYGRLEQTLYAMNEDNFFGRDSELRRKKRLFERGNSVFAVFRQVSELHGVVAAKKNALRIKRFV